LTAIIRIMPRAQRQIDEAAAWWAANRPGAPGAVRTDIQTALLLIAGQPGIGTRVELGRAEVVRRLYLRRLRYFLYYRVRGRHLDVVSFWHERRGDVPSI
jgi:plasmid stabilization system protein ParE